MRFRVYLDYAATTPLHPEVERVMRPFFVKKFGNPSSIHFFGQEAQSAIDDARETISHAIGANFREVIFTGSATEANNLALRGFFLELDRRGISLPRPRLITTEIEHESVLEVCRRLEDDGTAEVVYLPVDVEGRVKLDALRDALNERTVLVSVMYANNEIGTVQPIQEIAKIIQEFKMREKSFFPLFHTDAVQAFQFLNCGAGELGVDFMTLSAHKLYGPKGISALYARNFESGPQKGTFLSPLIAGGGHEFGLRSGTQNVPGIAGFAKAVELILKNQQKEARRLQKLKAKLWRGIKKIYKEAEINGVPDLKSGKVLPNILNVYFPRQNAHDLLIKLDLAGVAVSAGSACSARFLKPSHVVKALGCDSGRAKSNLRFSLGRMTAEKEVVAVLRIMAEILTGTGKTA